METFGLIWGISFKLLQVDQRPKTLYAVCDHYAGVSNSYRQTRDSSPTYQLRRNSMVSNSYRQTRDSFGSVMVSLPIQFQTLIGRLETFGIYTRRRDRFPVSNSYRQTRDQLIREKDRSSSSVSNSYRQTRDNAPMAKREKSRDSFKLLQVDQRLKLHAFGVKTQVLFQTLIGRLETLPDCSWLDHYSLVSNSYRQTRDVFRILCPQDGHFRFKLLQVDQRRRPIHIALPDATMFQTLIGRLETPLPFSCQIP